MPKKRTEIQTLLDPQHALRVYLDALLCEIDVDDDVVSANAAVDSDAQIRLDDESAETETRRRAKDAGRATAGTVDAETQAPESLASGIPEWAGREFQSLSFQVAGLTLAAPLEKLNGIVELHEDLAELPGYSPWVLGVLNNRGQNIQVIDIAQVVMPERRIAQNQENLGKKAKYVVLINGGNFGLAADSLSQVLRLSPDDVRWRGANGKRPWLAGTVIEQMCAILDIDRLIKALKDDIETSP